MGLPTVGRRANACHPPCTRPGLWKLEACQPPYSTTDTVKHSSPTSFNFLHFASAGCAQTSTPHNKNIWSSQSSAAKICTLLFTHFKLINKKLWSCFQLSNADLIIWRQKLLQKHFITQTKLDRQLQPTHTHVHTHQHARNLKECTEASVVFWAKLFIFWR